MSFTPGPWGLRGRQIRAEGGVGKHLADYMVCAEDGRLIAAAPEMHALLEELIACYDISVGGTSFGSEAREAIEQARRLLERVQKKEPWED